MLQQEFGGTISLGARALAACIVNFVDAELPAEVAGSPP